MTGNAGADDRILGTLRSADGEGVVRMEDRFDAAVDEVWSALTDPGRLALWFGEVEGDLRPGGEFRANLPDAGERAGHVDLCEPPHRLAVTMRDPDARPGQPGRTVIDGRLTADGDGTIVVWEERGLPVHLLAAYGTGIQIHVEQLGDHVAGREPRPSEPRWEVLLPLYEALTAGVG
jgi:uncharacterized protein YndB with AHSA1/START domain